MDLSRVMVCILSSGIIGLRHGTSVLILVVWFNVRYILSYIRFGETDTKDIYVLCE